jgi:hypothetical protein
MATEPVDERCAEALSTVRLSDPELGGLAELAMGALRATSGFPSDTPDEVIEQFRKEH